MLFIDTLPRPIDLLFVADRGGPYQEVFHFHPFVELFYIHEGRGQVIVDQRVYEVGPGTLLFFRPFQPHYQQMQIKPSQPYIRSLFRYDPGYFVEFLKPFPTLYRFHDSLSRSAEVLHVQMSPVFAQLDGFIRDTRQWFCDYGEGDDLEQPTLFLLSLFKRIQPLWQFEDMTDSRQPASDPFIVRVLEWIDEHHGEPFQLETLAKAVHLSPKYLSNLFRKTTGKTITDFLTIRRLKSASQLLQTTTLTVQEVSERAGYTNCSHFCHTFRKYVGMTPGEFRARPLAPV
ncbi:AraC family transcriptional regulator [Paenibacillus ginsengarvi]|uniref:AraC family transcriptional regulator n=1 Tax=Paenibacillus ginsengarvi TaxID=400777 RepID=A0A3B0CQ42_9BACL|nr:AraC family transcriptional regulator [Paenibacillus ginsengarvi]RKN86069.1 AraC family transcriptional regulator [Paenibacillus ginsengarvi]